MNKQQNKNRRLIVIIFAMSFIPFLFAWYLKENPALLKDRTNYGELIIPPLSTDLIDLNGIDQFSSNNISELAGHWVLVNVIPGTDCQKACLEALHKTRQILLMMNKDLTRMRRVALLFNEIAPELAAAWWSDDSRLLRAKPNAAFKQKIYNLRKSGVAEGMLFLMDPLGNVMMQYESGFDPYKVKDDLKKLLMVSQIG